jgi:hypothetical protein
MKRTLSIIGIVTLMVCQATSLQDDIRIGNYTYKIKRTENFLKDESYNCKWLSVLTPDDEPQAGLLVEARRNDTLFVSGIYKIDSNKFIVKNYYHHRHRHEPDSTIKTFVQNRKGKLELRSFIEFTDGKEKVIK